MPATNHLRIALLVGSTGALVACTQGSHPATTARPTASDHPATAADGWVPVAHGRMADAFVERVLYEKPGALHFYVHVRVARHAGANLGVALGDYFGVLYPNQWGASPTPNRQVVDEERMTQPPLDDGTRARLLADFQLDAMALVAGGGSLDYYRDFNASSRADVERQSRGYPYVIVAMDGRLDVTDGVEAERIVVSDDTMREVALDVPVEWRVIPAGAIVLSDR
jgi:hypothetical protein